MCGSHTDWLLLMIRQCGICPHTHAAGWPSWGNARIAGDVTQAVDVGDAADGKVNDADADVMLILIMVAVMAMMLMMAAL